MLASEEEFKKPCQAWCFLRVQNYRLPRKLCTTEFRGFVPINAFVLDLQTPNPKPLGRHPVPAEDVRGIQVEATTSGQLAYIVVRARHARGTVYRVGQRGGAVS